ncbi:MAG TPA: PLP-dependent aminotransferase family protein [Galbitalea sp.]|nr:PLP-dependent aminotransferase family protein [Galbitalea sp.]
MDVHVSLGPVGDRTNSIYRQLSAAIVDGSLRGGEALPPTRDLAASLGVSRTTVSVAYDRLLAEGFTVTRRGAGTFVAADRSSISRSRAPHGRAVHPRAVWAGAGINPDRHDRAAYDFAIGVPDPALFPLAAWRRNVARELQSDSAVMRGYSNPAGVHRLRVAIARHIGLSRAVRAGEEDVIVTSGAQQAVDLVARVLVAPGDIVVVENPGYPPVRALFETLGARVVPVPVDADGIVVSELPARAKLVYTTPSHQFPTAVRASLDRRLDLLAWAESNNAVILEDDYDSEFHYGAGSLDPLQNLDRTGRVVYVGTFSKTLLPALRLGFLVAPASLAPALMAAKRLSDSHTDSVSQGALARLIDDGTFAAHLRKANRVYAERRDAIRSGLARELTPWLEVAPSVAGLHLFAALRPDRPLRTTAVREAAAAAGVGIQSVANFTVGPETPQSRLGFVLGYGAINTEHISLGIHRLAEVFARLS